MGKSDLKRSRSDDDDVDTKRSKTAGAGDVSSSKASRKAQGKSEPLEKLQDNEGNFYWGLSKARRVTISHFKGNVLVNVREYFESGGEMRPGKKGISLSLEQYKQFVKAVPQINAQLREDGIAISDAEDSDAGEGSSKDKEASAKKSKKESKKAKNPPKANIDATSDEESD